MVWTVQHSSRLNVSFFCHQISNPNLTFNHLTPPNAFLQSSIPLSTMIKAHRNEPDQESDKQMGSLFN